MGRTLVAVTSWRDPRDLATLKRYFYRDPDASRRGLARDMVQVWEIAGKAPHAVVATADLARVQDADREGTRPSPELLGIYMSAWIRFVDGIMDNEQTSRQKKSMYQIARDLKMPASFVELRHRCTHEAKPQLHELRRESERAMNWLYHWFWSFVEDIEENDVTF